MEKIRLSNVLKKHLKIVGFLIVSGAGAILLKTGFFQNPITVAEVLSMLLAPAVNYAVYVVYLELKKEGVVEFLKQK